MDDSERYPKYHMDTMHGFSTRNLERGVLCSSACVVKSRNFPTNVVFEAKRKCNMQSCLRSCLRSVFKMAAKVIAAAINVLRT